ncbi:hypothetical protein BDW60DRAFT_220888 [Aspergillus nidulans var. acristatus]
MLMWHLCQPAENDTAAIQARTLARCAGDPITRRASKHLGKRRRSGSDRETQQVEMQSSLGRFNSNHFHAQAMPTMSNELEYRSASLGRPSTTTAEESTSKRSPFSIPSKKQNQKLIELRPKGPLVLVAPASPMDFKRKQHAQAQKQQRDRMKSALERMAQMLATGTGGVHAGTANCGTKVELVEAAVDYIERLQGQIEELRASHATERLVSFNINAKQAKSPYERGREDTDAQITGFPEDGPRSLFKYRDWSRWASK